MQKLTMILLSFFILLNISQAQDSSSILEELVPYTIAALQDRDYPGGDIEIISILDSNADFTQYY